MEISATQNSIFYIHPWELDINQPKIAGLSRRIKFTHYVNLDSTEKKVIKLLSDFECTKVADIISTNKNEPIEQVYSY